MDFQSAFNLAVGLAAFLGGYILKTINESLKGLQAGDIELTKKVQQIEVLVAGEYVKNTDLEKLTTALFSKLDKISDKLDNKADKPK